MDTPTTWPEFIKVLIEFEQLSDLPKEHRPTSYKLVVGRLIEAIPRVIRYDGQHATVLELAVLHGSKPLIDALPIEGASNFAQLDDTQWHKAMQICTGDMLSAAVAKGLIPPSTWDLLDALFKASEDNPSLKGFIVGEVSRHRCWFSSPRDIEKQWAFLPDTTLASAFLENQVACFRNQTESLLICADLIPATVLQLAGAISPLVGPKLPHLIEAQSTAHEKIEIQAAFRNLHNAHQFLHADACQTRQGKNR